MINYLIYKKLDEKAFAGELLNLFKNDYIELNNIKNEISFPRRDTHNLERSENHFLVWLKNLSKNNILSLASLMNKAKNVN